VDHEQEPQILILTKQDKEKIRGHQESALKMVSHSYDPNFTIFHSFIHFHIAKYNKKASEIGQEIIYHCPWKKKGNQSTSVA